MMKALPPATSKLLRLSLMLMLMLAGTARAQIAEVVVTAQRAPSLESRTPVAMTTPSAER